MKYEPEFNPLKNFNYKSKEQLQQHLDFVGLSPNEPKPYYCTVCKKRFLTPLGAMNHVDFVHTELVINVLKGMQ